MRAHTYSDIASMSYQLDSLIRINDHEIIVEPDNGFTIIDNLGGHHVPRHTPECSISLAASESTSVKSGSSPHEYKNGRRYQGLLPDRYGLPNDEQEQDRELFKHRLFSDYVLDGRHFVSPVGDRPEKLVDLGCGTGYWSLDVAESYPNTKVIGSDISPIQPPCPSSNLEFHIEDLDDESTPWTSIYRDADLVFMRSVLQAMRQRPLFLQRAFDSLKPGGWIECHEVVLPVTWEDGTKAFTHPLSMLYDRMEKGPFKHIYGWDVYLPQRIPATLQEAGFVNVSQKHTHVPIGRWHPERRMREMGLLSQAIIIDWIGAVMNKYEEMGMSEDEADAFIRDIMASVENPDCHARLDWAVFWAQKPYS